MGKLESLQGTFHLKIEILKMQVKILKRVAFVILLMMGNTLYAGAKNQISSLSGEMISVYGISVLIIAA